MAKTITKFVCQECGYDSPQWLGKCPECGNWNSFKEFHESKSAISKQRSVNSGLMTKDQRPMTLQQIDLKETQRIDTKFDELNTVLGGGIVPGAVMLLAGDPGIGKSTLLLQLALNIAAPDRTQIALSKSDNQKKSENSETSGTQNRRVPSESHQKVLYISGEESVEQIKLRASRIKGALENTNLLLFAQNDTDAAVDMIEQENPSLVIIDSIQTMESESLEGLSGSVGQVRYGATQFIRVAKANNIPIIIVGHVTKEGMVAGPMVLSHMVDTVLFLEGEKFTTTRLLRSLKNRFGPVDEVGVFLMEEGGMQEVRHPEQLFLTKREEATPGSVLTVIMEGTRPFLIEVQALVVYSKFPMPRRVASGFDNRRLELLLAVLQKQCRLSVESMDVFVNIAGGLKVTDPGVDLAVCLAIFSSLKNVTLSDTIAIAEVGLLGELRTVGGLDKRIREAEKLGFTNITTSKNNKSLSAILNNLGYTTKSEKTWQQQDERHFKVEK